MKYYALLILLLATFALSAAHLVGGEISYECVGNNIYKITLKVYRDCNSTGAPFDPNASIAIYYALNNNQYTTLNPSPSSTITIPAVVNNPCLQTPPNICTEMAIYQSSVYLPPTNGGYVISYQRCCRNQTISNIPNPGFWGSTYTVSIPPNDTACNSSPSFLSNPPIVLCTGEPLNINASAAEPDGDSVYYELCNPLHGGSQSIPRPVPSNPPPYIPVPFLTQYSASNPLPGNPPFQINPQTGIITGKPNQVGQFVVGICASEYRNGVYLGRVLRDYQFNVMNCQSNVTASITANTQYCTGRTVTFANNSYNGTIYHWDFGEANLSTDTSNAFSPTYTFTDTGTYEVTLIVNPGWPCSDTIVKTISVHYPATSSFTYSGNLCENSGVITFTPTGSYSAHDNFFWDFGPNAQPSTYNGRFPPPVIYTTTGKHVANLFVNSFGCTAISFDTVTIFKTPSIDFSIAKNEGCVPFTLRFNDSSQASTTIQYEWDFGDGNSSTNPSPVHTYTSPGVYDIYLKIYTTEGCRDTLEIYRPGYILVKPTPTSSVSISPTTTTIYNPVIEVSDLAAQPNENITTIMGDGIVYTNQKLITHQYRDTGTYEVFHIVSNQYGCADTTLTVVHINPQPLIFAPNAFSPNGDGKNDIYLPSIVGALEYEFIIFSRWGDIVFQTTDPYEGWNGTKHNTGAMLPQGVYTYTIHVRDINLGIASKKGQITLFR